MRNIIDMEIFNIHLEFDHNRFRERIFKAIVEKEAGYMALSFGSFLRLHTDIRMEKYYLAHNFIMSS